jgi:hypothetical protein
MTTRKNKTKSLVSKDMPEIDDVRFTFIGRGLYAKHAQQVFGNVVVERAVLDAIGGEQGAANVLRALAASLAKAPTHKQKKRAA